MSHGKMVTMPESHYKMLLKVVSWVNDTMVAPSSIEWISEGDAMVLTGLSKSGMYKLRVKHPHIFRQRCLGVTKPDKNGNTKTIARGIQYNKQALNNLFTSPIITQS